MSVLVYTQRLFGFIKSDAIFNACSVMESAASIGHWHMMSLKKYKRAKNSARRSYNVRDSRTSTYKTYFRRGFTHALMHTCRRSFK